VRISAAMTIYRALHADLVSMTLAPGTALTEKALTERFNVSRTPVREALIRLGEDGLVDILPQSGTFVSRIPVGQIPEAVIIRKALEGATVARAAATASRYDIAHLDQIIVVQRQLAAIDDATAFLAADESFHEAIAVISGHPGIWDYLKPAKAQIDRARRLTMLALHRMNQAIEEHQIIRDAIANHDPAAAVAAMDHHLGAVIPDIAQLRDQYPDCFV
jgi:DNA-binding GntR family transcriptional regulator